MDIKKIFHAASDNNSWDSGQEPHEKACKDDDTKQRHCRGDGAENTVAQSRDHIERLAAKRLGVGREKDSPNALAYEIPVREVVSTAAPCKRISFA